jgi:hypothetical protein
MEMKQINKTIFLAAIISVALRSMTSVVLAAEKLDSSLNQIERRLREES